MNENLINHLLARLAASDMPAISPGPDRSPVHVVYGGAHLFRADTPAKFGRLATQSIENYAPNFAEFARALWLNGCEILPRDKSAIEDLEFSLADDPELARKKSPEAWFAWTIFRKTLKKLETAPVEDFRIDFEDGYGIRTDLEEDGHCETASAELARLFDSADSKARPPGSGIRVKSFQPETRHRALRTFELFMSGLVEKTGGRIPEGFVVTLPKIIGPAETETLAMLLDDFERRNGITNGTIGIEIVVETLEALPVLREIAEGCGGRCTSAHFGAFDFTSRYGIAAVHQHIRHQACDFARNVMQLSLAPLGIRLSDSVTTQMPIPVHRSGNLSIEQIAENQLAVREAWRRHFNNILHSQINGFYQSWDLHPAQLVPRYAAVYVCFLESFDAQAKRLHGFIEKATQAMTTGNMFDDLASAEGLLNFFRQGLRCGAFAAERVAAVTGLKASEIQAGTFIQIMENRFAQNA
ncbi:MAG: aldolase/citrate lyase family protein [Acidobacteriota bacterium]|nr:aldolase/citrate lyase family protein [Acidobacteriota bacterium]MDH3528399.1 aldolase/citrate lyase family protein [Acidobacteriota bacterium]